MVKCPAGAGLGPHSPRIKGWNITPPGFRLAPLRTKIASSASGSTTLGTIKLMTDYPAGAA
jgi:hypothetical protein